MQLKQYACAVLSKLFLCITYYNTHLCKDSSNPDSDKDWVAYQPLCNIVLVVDLASIDLIEESHHDKCVEDHSEVSGRWGMHILYILDAIINTQQIWTYMNEKKKKNIKPMKIKLYNSF